MRLIHWVIMKVKLKKKKKEKSVKQLAQCLAYELVCNRKKFLFLLLYLRI